MTAARVAPLIVLSTLAAAVAAAPQSSTAKLDNSAKALAARAAAYVADYQTKFAFLVAEENYTQAVWRRDQLMKRRAMKGELFLTFLRTDREWIAVHDVAEVDGQPVPDRENLQSLLQSADVVAVGMRIANRNAAFNIGSVSRNFNEPTLALLVLEAKRIAHFKFDRRDFVNLGGVDLATLAFTEQDGPTIVRGSAPVYSRGEIVIETATGRVRRSVITFRETAVTATLTTDYGPEDRLGLWVPRTFTERYELVERNLRETTSCEATYANYRRFEVTGRIK
jgi:hypothetical protein